MQCLERWVGHPCGGLVGTSCERAPRSSVPAARGDECARSLRSLNADYASPPLCRRAQLFGLANQLEGVGSDASGEFTLSGNYTDDEIFFVIKLKSSRSQQSRTFAGKRKKDDMSISGRWWVSEGGSPSGEFMLSYEDAERRFAPSCKLHCLWLERNCTASRDRY